MSNACATFKVILGFINMVFFCSPPFVLIIPANYNPFCQINGVRFHDGMAMCQVSFDVQNPQGGLHLRRNRTFTEHVFLLAHGPCLLQCH